MKRIVINFISGNHLIFEVHTELVDGMLKDLCYNGNFKLDSDDGSVLLNFKNIERINIGEIND